MARALPLAPPAGPTPSAPAAAFVRRSRAVERPIDPGNHAACASCGMPVKFTARVRCRQVIANVYLDGRWDRVEHFHAACYATSGDPYGAPQA